MPINLRQYNLKPNSNYNVSLTLKKGDRVIDGLRSIYVSTPKYLTTSIENISTASTIIFDRSYQRNTIREPSVDITLAEPGKFPSTQIIKLEVTNAKIKKTTASTWNAEKRYVNVSYKGKLIPVEAVDDTIIVRLTLKKNLTYTGVVTLSSNNTKLRWMNFPKIAKIEDVNYVDVVITPRQIDPAIVWDARGYWASVIMAELVEGWGPDSGTAYLTYPVDHAEKIGTPGSKTIVTGIYQDVQGLTQTLKTSVQNQDLISQLYWDDIDEPDAIRDVIYFFFRDDTDDGATILTEISEWTYLDDYFIAGFPMALGNAVTAANDSNPSAGFVTYTASGHTFGIGDIVKITGATIAGYNGSFTITAKTANTFTVANETTGSGAFTAGYAVSSNTINYNRATGTKLSTTVPALDESYLTTSEPVISLNKIVYQTGAIYENLKTPTQVRVAFTIAQYKKNKTTGVWQGSWLKTIPTGLANEGYPVLSIPEILTGSS